MSRNKHTEKEKKKKFCLSYWTAIYQLECNSLLEGMDAVVDT